mmetsp:Transcript_24444/g.60371  ORF Transcript_24444/g.60371 Transcript_24444/m.60371 type:complete len:150 (-) Transcript_24444:1328-1777(-)
MRHRQKATYAPADRYVTTRTRARTASLWHPLIGGCAHSPTHPPLHALSASPISPFYGLDDAHHFPRRPISTAERGMGGASINERAAVSELCMPEKLAPATNNLAMTTHRHTHTDTRTKRKKAEWITLSGTSDEEENAIESGQRERGWER